MATKLITMLTYNDETVDDALSIFRGCAGLESGVENMVQVKDRFEPNPDTKAAYEEMYGKYVDLYDSLTGMFAWE